MNSARTSASKFAAGIGAAGILVATGAYELHAQQPAQQPTQAQQPAPQPPPTWKHGQPPSIADSKLAPVAPPPLPTPADKLPLDKLKVKPGFKIEVYAAGVPNARTLRLGDKGTVFVSSRVQDKVHAIVTKNGKRELKFIASGLHRPNGIALHKGTLYIAELSQISKIEKIEDVLDNRS